MIFIHLIKGLAVTIPVITLSFAVHLNRANSLKEEKVTYPVHNILTPTQVLILHGKLFDADNISYQDNNNQYKDVTF